MLTISPCASVQRTLLTAYSRRDLLGLFPVNVYLATNRIGRHRNVDKNVKDAYTWLAGVYEEGDRIWLFGAPSLPSALADDNDKLVGFSRGAYQVRALASMIHEVRIWSIYRIRGGCLIHIYGRLVW